MARLSRATPKAVNIREDSDVDDAYNYTNPSKYLGARRGGTTGGMSATTATSATAMGKPKPFNVTRSPTKTKTKTGTYGNSKSIATKHDDGDDDDDDNDPHPYAPVQKPRGARQRQRRQLGPRHTNSLLMPFPAAIDRYDGLTPGRGLGDVENAPLPEHLEEYKYGVGRESEKRNKEKEKERGEQRGKEGTGAMARGGGKTVPVEVERKNEWRDKGKVVESEDEEEENENDSEETDEFDSLDDFIVGDDEDISYFDDSSLVESDEDGDGEEEEELLIRTRSSPRKLFRGLKATTPKAPLQDEGAGENNTNTAAGGRGGGGGGGRRGAVAVVNLALNVNEEAVSSRPTPRSLFDGSSEDGEHDVFPSLPKNFDLDPPPSFTASKSKSPQKGKGIDRKAPSDNMEESEKAERAAGIVTPPSSPSKPRLYSPSKGKSRIPPTPHRPSIDAFWSQDIINEWNDQYSPRKMKTPRRGLERFHIFSDNDDVDDQGRSGGNRSSISPMSSPSKSPIKGSPTKKASAAAAAATKKALAAMKKEFDEKKVWMAEDFFKALDDTVTGGEIQRLAASAGGVKIIWSKTLNTTAGRANWKRETTRQKPASLSVQSQSQWKQQGSSSSSLSFSSSGHENENPTSSKATPTVTPASTTNNNNNNIIPLTTSLLAPVRHHASIELASKIIDSEDRLLNTLAHEYCHLTNFMISNVCNNPHGTSFKQWAAKCEKALATHPVYGGGGKTKVHITTKHSYVIHYKYLWCCVECGHEYGRHSRSIDVKKSRCGKCKVGGLLQIRPQPRGGSAKKGDVKGMGIGSVAVEKVTQSMGGVHLDTYQ